MKGNLYKTDYIGLLKSDEILSIIFRKISLLMKNCVKEGVVDDRLLSELKDVILSLSHSLSLDSKQSEAVNAFRHFYGLIYSNLKTLDSSSTRDFEFLSEFAAIFDELSEIVVVSENNEVSS